jgi:putative membrane protein
MRRILSKYGIIIAVIYILSMVTTGVKVTSVAGILDFGIALILLNMLLKPVLSLIALPLTLLTFGLFSLVVNTWMVMLADFFVRGVAFSGFWYCLLFAACFNLIYYWGINLEKK